MTNDTKLEASLLLMHAAIAAFLFVWAMDKVIAPEHAQAVFSHFYFSELSPQALMVLGIAQIAVIAAFAVGLARLWSYGAVLLMHTASTVATYAQLVDPWGEGGQLLFWAAVPVLAAMIALFVLRDRDRLLSVDAARSK